MCLKSLFAILLGLCKKCWKQTVPSFYINKTLMQMTVTTSLLKETLKVWFWGGSLLLHNLICRKADQKYGRIHWINYMYSLVQSHAKWLPYWIMMLAASLDPCFCQQLKRTGIAGRKKCVKLSKLHRSFHWLSSSLWSVDNQFTFKFGGSLLMPVVIDVTDGHNWSNAS